MGFGASRLTPQRPTIVGNICRAQRFKTLRTKVSISDLTNQDYSAGSELIEQESSNGTELQATTEADRDSAETADDFAAAVGPAAAVPWTVRDWAALCRA